ncbi:MAG: hypothetical protein H8M99_05715 [Gloeobacteraceae cyanobacterium ES-bin-144]|nr:hypothetical protein [Verrucomicrobiales bacterium]
MSNSPFLTIFPSQLHRWTIHCSLNALPSFCIALIALKLWKSPPAIAAMLCAIATFILLYATLTSLSGPLVNDNHVLSRSLKLGAKIRAWISGISVLLLLTVKGVLITPDLWCGILAINILNRIASFFGAANPYLFRPRSIDDMAGFFRIFATTMTEGIILSFLLFMISFFAVIFLQARDRTRVFAVADPG